MIVGFVDVVRSTDAIEREGFPAILHLREQIRDLCEIVGTVGPPAAPRFVGERQGDGFMFAGPREHALAYLKEILKTQMTTWMHSAWMPMRFSLGLAVASWDGEPWAKGNAFNGRDVTLAARLLDHCEPGGVVIGKELHQLVWEHAPELRRLFCETVAVLQGFEQPEAYWALKNRQRGRRMSDAKVMAVVAGVLLLLGASAAGTWRTAFSIDASQAAALDQARSAEGSMQALLWTLCESAPSCKARNLEEPPYLRMLREKQQGKATVR